jgi:hypothetical protein
MIPITEECRVNSDAEELAKSAHDYIRGQRILAEIKAGPVMAEKSWQERLLDWCQKHITITWPKRGEK